SRMLQGERDLATVSNLIMSELAPLVNAQYGVFYVTKREEEETKLELVASYGADSPEEIKQEFHLREGLVGQAAADRRPILLKDVPPDFIRISSGLGRAKPANVNILPALFEDEVKAVIELASFSEFNETHQNFLDQLMESVGIVLNTIAATMRTEGLLKQSQLLTQELQARQTELTRKQQVEFARTINSAGSDLLNLINDILDLSKIESGTVSIDVGDMPMMHLKQHMQRTFRQLAADKGLDFNVKFDPKLPQTIRTDEK